MLICPRLSCLCLFNFLKLPFFIFHLFFIGEMFDLTFATPFLVVVCFGSHSLVLIAYSVIRDHFWRGSGDHMQAGSGDQTWVGYMQGIYIYLPPLHYLWFCDKRQGSEVISNNAQSRDGHRKARENWENMFLEF